MGQMSQMAGAIPLRPHEGAPVCEAGAEQRTPLSQRADGKGQVRVSQNPAFNRELSPCRSCEYS